MKILLRWLINSAAIFAVPYIVPGVHVLDLYTAIMAAFVIGLINMIIRPILMILTLPITILTLGLSTLLINALLFWFVSTFVKGFYVDGFIPALLGSLAFWAISWIGNAIAGTKK